MKTHLTFLALFFLPLLTYSQRHTFLNHPAAPLTSTHMRWIGNSFFSIEEYWTDTLKEDNWPKIRFQFFDSNVDNPHPVSFLWTDSNGYQKRTSISALDTIVKPDSSIYATQSWVNQNFSATEIDPLFTSSPSNSISNTNIVNWNTVYNWGNHSTQGYLKGVDTLQLSNRINSRLRISDTTNKWKSINYIPTWGQVTGKPSFATVAISGNYNDLTNKPTSKRIENYFGNTNASGNYTVTYSTPFTQVPNVQPQLQSGTPSQVVRIISSTTTGFTVQVTNRTTATILGIEVLLAATAVVNNSPVGVLVVER